MICSQKYNSRTKEDENPDKKTLSIECCGWFTVFFYRYGTSEIFLKFQHFAGPSPVNLPSSRKIRTFLGCKKKKKGDEFRGLSRFWTQAGGS